MTTTVSILLTVVLAGLVTGKEEISQEHPHSLEQIGDDHDHDDSMLSGEHQRKRTLDLEDPGSWSASGEVLDENHAWFRRRRSVHRTKREVAPPKLEKETAHDVHMGQDMEAAESAVFMPAHLRLKKKHAYEECRKGHETYRTMKAHAHTARWPCNEYCCFPVAMIL